MEQAERLTSLIYDVIHRIPENDRDTIRVSFEMGTIQGEALGEYCLRHIILDGEKLASYSDDAVRAVIAHEIAHSVPPEDDDYSLRVLSSTGQLVLTESVDDDYSISERERAVDKRIQEWGFVAELQALNREAKEKMRKDG